MARDTRSRMIAGAARLVGTRGAASMSLRELARAAGVPIGSTYHHFPGGKQQLVEEAVRSVGAHVTRRIEAGRDDGPAAALEALADEWRDVLERTGFGSGCPVLAVATEDDPALGALATQVFEAWQESLTAVLVDAGVDEQRAPRLAMLVVAAIEGAVALCRAERSLRPLEDSVVELRGLLDSALG
ncbi:TetR/AcrR family transcriptional regulator [Nocardioides sp. TF02-7]|uniref:TetR/AcrR family transcriptional regulator n=1 Tax=Nocardioides sp. TF02-7 TaxID=2917724 RepID=UPI001F0665F8|nr:TetR/AcrR family transcriptional regulator [Nocardioides sp. TF02-7]UMG94327.1 TetR/AcrR family transcriptional regulator [Nocardioides sp. TF02-7]